MSDDASYTFLNSSTKTETRGQLSTSEFNELKAIVASPSLENLYQQRNADDNACNQAEDGYVLSSRLGSACFVISTVSDPAAKEDLDFVTTLYQEKSEAK